MDKRDEWLASAYTAAFNVIWIYRSAFRGTAQRHDRFLLIRSENAKYCATKVTAGVLTGGTLFMIANIVFGLMMLIAFPAYISFSVDEQMIYADWYGTGNMVLIYVVKRLIGSFLYGMAASMFGIGAAIFLGIGICCCAFRFYLITYTRRFCRNLHLKPGSGEV